MSTRVLLLVSAPLVLFLSGCLEPVPFDHPGYPRNSGSNLRYPRGHNSPNYGNPNTRYDNRYPTSENQWNRPSRNERDLGYNEPLRRDPVPEPKPDPKPKPPEEDPLIKKNYDPIEESTKPEYPYGIPVQGTTNLVVSPYAKDGPYIDTSGFSSGTQIECPKTGKTILVP